MVEACLYTSVSNGEALSLCIIPLYDVAVAKPPALVCIDHGTED